MHKSTETKIPKKLLIVVASPTRSTTLDTEVGLWAAELTHAWLEFREAGYDMEIASPNGGAVALDAYSDPRHESGYSADDIVSLGFLESTHAALLTNTTRLEDVRAGDYDALYIAGGQAPMFSFRENQHLQALIRAFFESGRVTAAVCHGTAALLDTKLSDGSLLIAGKRMTGFANSEEDIVDETMGTKVMPYRIEDEAVARKAEFIVAPPFQAHVVIDDNLVTGQQQCSGKLVARTIIEILQAESVRAH